MMDSGINGKSGDGNSGSVLRVPAGSPKRWSRRAPGAKTRWPWASWTAVAVVTAVLLWGANALAARPVIDEPGALRAFLGNLQIFAVATTSAVAASVAWASYGLGRERGEIPVWVLSLVASLASLACGLGISWGLAAPPAPGPARDLVAGGLRLAGALGTGFALVGAVVSDLSVGLATKAARARARRVALTHGATILMLTSLWVGAGIVAAGLSRAQVCGP